MALFKCKMCGGNLEVQDGMTVCECEYCGSKQTVPKLDDEKKYNLFSRANRLRIGNEFDKAANVYESIVTEFPEEAEAYWGIILSKYGIEYVDDPKTGKKIPTCHRSSFESVMDDQNFEMVMEYSDPTSRAVYREEAKIIEGLRTKIIEISSKEEPYDIFICYKETNALGERTIDSVIAQDVYDALTEKGYKVFFSRISLEDKLGQEYEPYIFSALNSARVMLTFGTDYEYFNAVWVKNEWSRFLSLIAKGDKKTLIPCYKGIDAYDMPKEFAKLQAQDMGKVGAIQDLVRGIEKIIGKKGDQECSNDSGNTVVPNFNIDGKLNRAFQFIEDEDFYKAEGLLDTILEMDNSCSKAYIGLLLCELGLTSEEELSESDEFIGLYKNFIRAKENASPEYRRTLDEYETESKNRYMSESGLDENYEYCINKFNNPDEFTYYSSLAQDFKEILDAVGSWKEASQYYEKCCIKVNEEQTKKDNQLKHMQHINAYADNLIKLKGSNLLGIRDNGTLTVAGPQLSGLLQKISSWNQIVRADFSDNADLIVAIDETGQFISTSISVTHKMSEYRFKDVKAGLDCIVGLKKDGSVYGLINNEVFEPNDWTDIIQLECSGNLIVGLDAKGMIHTNNAKLNDKLELRVMDYKYVLCAENDIYLIDKSDNAYALLREGEFKQFENIRKIRVNNKKLIAVTNQNVCISEMPTGLHVRMIKSFYDIRGPRTEKYYQWSENLVDVGLINGTLYGVKTDGSLIHSKKEVTRIDGIDYYDFSCVDEEVENAVLILTNEKTLVVVFSDGSVRTNNKDINTKTWKLFDDVYLSEADLAEKRKLAKENGNTMFASDSDTSKAHEENAKILAIIDKNIDDVRRIATLPENEKRLELDRLKESEEMMEEVSIMAWELDPEFRKPIEEKILEFKKAIEDATTIKSVSEDFSVRFCTKCGNPIRVGKKFCSKCGNPVKA